ncbi:MAG TPA: hypothetical protein VHG08_16540 [Longimicrobium sp.]|nr:hypothetical protein [Longimicrobium sp.]
MPISLPRALLLLALCAALPARAAAQGNGHTLEPGDTVRVVAAAWGPRVIEGELLVYHADSLALRETATGTRYAVELGGVRKLSKNEGLDRRRSVRRAGTAGLFMGFSLGAVTGPLISMGRHDDSFERTTLVTSLGGGVLGLGLGAAFGAVFAREHWQPFRTPIIPPRYSAGGMALEIRIPVP